MNKAPEQAEGGGAEASGGRRGAEGGPVGNLPNVLSASRTKDPIARNPDVLASILCGESPAAFGPSSKSRTVHLEDFAVLVLWTKDPTNLLKHPELNRVVSDFSGHSYLNLTVTGLGGTFMEPGIPKPEQVFDVLRDIIDAGILSPEWVLLRYDPLLEVRTPGGKVLTNTDRELFGSIIKEAASIGITRCATSRMDFQRYPQVAERLRRFGIEPKEVELEDLITEMDSVASHQGIELSCCVDPVIDGITDRFGCIDGELFNELIGEDLCDTSTHSAQRHGCKCTRSVDIGYSKGLQQCFTGGKGCLYCYSQRGYPKKLEHQVQHLLSKFEQNQNFSPSHSKHRKTLDAA